MSLQKQDQQTPSVQPLHPILDSRENIARARVQQLAAKQKLQYVSPSDRTENLSPTSKKLLHHKLKHLHKNPANRLSSLRLQAAIGNLNSSEGEH